VGEEKQQGTFTGLKKSFGGAHERSEDCLKVLEDQQLKVIEDQMTLLEGKGEVLKDHVIVSEDDKNAFLFWEREDNEKFWRTICTAVLMTSSPARLSIPTRQICL
jgi:hypothetical protein